MKYLLLLVVLLGGCAGANKAIIYHYPEGTKTPVISVELDKPGKIRYKEDGKYELELDGKTEPLFSGLIKSIKVENE